nr:MAG TPA: hypothetical protein [Bacteriophage sp.]
MARSMVTVMTKPKKLRMLIRNREILLKLL